MSRPLGGFRHAAWFGVLWSVVVVCLVVTGVLFVTQRAVLYLEHHHP